MNATHNVLELFESRVKESLPLFVCLFLFPFALCFFFCFCFFANRKEEERYMATKGEL